MTDFDSPSTQFSEDKSSIRVLYDFDSDVSNGITCSVVPNTLSDDDMKASLTAVDGMRDCTVSHANIRNALVGSAYPDTVLRNESVSLIFQETVKQILTLLRPCSFS